jgi:hypothetical protein
LVAQLNNEEKERGVTETTCRKDGNNEFGVCVVKCREVRELAY